MRCALAGPRANRPLGRDTPYEAQFVRILACLLRTDSVVYAVALAATIIALRGVAFRIASTNAHRLV